MINNGTEVTVSDINQNLEYLNILIKSNIRSFFDMSLVSQSAASWIKIAELYGYKKLAEEMRRDLETELGIKFDFGNENIPDENIDPDTY